jgi:hypothetical protein
MDFDNLKPFKTDVPQPLFPLGFVAVTPEVEQTLSPADIARALARHAAGDWGELCPEDRRANDDALQAGGRLLSVYRARESGERLLVLTDADRSATTVLFPASAARLWLPAVSRPPAPRGAARPRRR